MTAVDPATRAEIAAELAKHDWRNWECSCGVAMENLTNDVPHATYEDIHLADTLAPLIARLCAEKVDQALAEVEAHLNRRAGQVVRDNHFADGIYHAVQIVAARRTGGER